eukprot:5049235-Prymnesium_polylepis.1
MRRLRIVSRPTPRSLVSTERSMLLEPAHAAADRTSRLVDYVVQIRVADGDLGEEGDVRRAAQVVRAPPLKECASALPVPVPQSRGGRMWAMAGAEDSCGSAHGQGWWWCGGSETHTRDLKRDANS